jgi:hypothetical protein
MACSLGSTVCVIHESRLQGVSDGSGALKQCCSGSKHILVCVYEHKNKPGKGRETRRRGRILLMWQTNGDKCDCSGALCIRSGLAPVCH